MGDPQRGSADPYPAVVPGQDLFGAKSGNRYIYSAAPQRTRAGKATAPSPPPEAPSYLLRLAGRVRFQLGVGVMLAVVMPAALRFAITGTNLANPSITNSALVSLAALVGGYFVHRHLRVFPGGAPNTSILTTFSAAYAIGVAFVLLARIDYSTIQFAAHFVITLLFFALVEWRVAAARRLAFAVVPGGGVKRLPELQNVTWHTLSSPAEALAGVHGLVADLGANHSDAWNATITHAVMSGVPVYHHKQLIEQLSGTIDIEHLAENTLGAINPNSLYLKVKSVADFIAASALLVVVIPLLVIVGIAIRMESRGPAIFRQQRTGFRAVPFTVYKFRTMRIEGDLPDGAERNAAITVDRDPRITRLGGFLRKTRIDELPQLLNVIRGEMSLIGPRPEAVPLTEWYEQEIAFYHYRHIIKPGLTGWAQINQGHVADIDDTRKKLHYDFYYVKNYSIWLDIMIAVRTVGIVITGNGSR